MGGPEKVARHHAGGKLTVRERVDRLLDPGSFHEVGAISGQADYDADGQLTSLTPTNLVTGRGRIDGRPVVVAGDDFTVRGGANDAGIREKMVQVEKMANELQPPLVRLVDGTGGGGSVKTIEMEGRTYVPAVRGWDVVVDNLSTVPVVALALGSVAGLGAARVAASHYSVMVRETSQMFVAGPPVVARIGESLGKNELGGSDIHTRNGAVDDEAESEEAAFERTRRFLSYLPASVYEVAPRIASEDPPGRRDDWLIEAVPRDPRKVYKMRRIIEAVVDRDSFFEIGRLWGRSCDHRFRPAFRLAGGAAGQRPACLWRRLVGQRLREGDALRRPGRSLPSARGPSRRHPRFPDRPGGRAGGDHPLRCQSHGGVFPVSAYGTN